MWFIRRSERDKILAAAEALRIFNGHDSGANLRSRYGEKWWKEIDQIEAELRALVSTH